jgi:adenylate kinase
MTRPEALLLLGPTGAGKTPLGEHLQARGLWDRRCAHFDFGAQLRAAAAPTAAHDLTLDEMTVVRRSLETGALLEDSQFGIAAKLLQAFLRRCAIAPADLVILNGLPRHVGQARDVDRLVRVTAVVNLSCTAQVVHERIAMNSGGDRTDRVDDDVVAIARKLRIYEERTRPLVEHYRAAGAVIHSIEVQVRTQPEDVWRQLTSQV